MAKHILRQKKLLFIGDVNRSVASYNRIKFKSKICEGLKHYITKCMIGRVIREKDEVFFSEFEAPNTRKIDILHIKKNKEMVGYEIESTRNVKDDINGVNIITVYVKNIPDNINDIHKYIKDKIVV